MCVSVSFIPCRYQKRFVHLPYVCHCQARREEKHTDGFDVVALTAALCSMHVRTRKPIQGINTHTHTQVNELFNTIVSRDQSSPTPPYLTQSHAYGTLARADEATRKARRGEAGPTGSKDATESPHVALTTARSRRPRRFGPAPPHMPF